MQNYLKKHRQTHVFVKEGRGVFLDERRMFETSHSPCPRFPGISQAIRHVQTIYEEAYHDYLKDRGRGNGTLITFHSAVSNSLLPKIASSKNGVRARFCLIIWIKHKMHVILRMFYKLHVIIYICVCIHVCTCISMCIFIYI